MGAAGIPNEMSGVFFGNPHKVIAGANKLGNCVEIRSSAGSGKPSASGPWAIGASFLLLSIGSGGAPSSSSHFIMRRSLDSSETGSADRGRKFNVRLIMGRAIFSDFLLEDKISKAWESFNGVGEGLGLKGGVVTGEDIMTSLAPGG